MTCKAEGFDGVEVLGDSIGAGEGQGEGVVVFGGISFFGRNGVGILVSVLPLGFDSIQMCCDGVCTQMGGIAEGFSVGDLTCNGGFGFLAELGEDEAIGFEDWLIQGVGTAVEIEEFSGSDPEGIIA